MNLTMSSQSKFTLVRVAKSALATNSSVSLNLTAFLHCPGGNLADPFQPVDQKVLERGDIGVFAAGPR